MDLLNDIYNQIFHESCNNSNDTVNVNVENDDIYNNLSVIGTRMNKRNRDNGSDTAVKLNDVNELVDDHFLTESSSNSYSNNNNNNNNNNYNNYNSSYNNNSSGDDGSSIVAHNDLIQLSSKAVTCTIIQPTGERKGGKRCIHNRIKYNCKDCGGSSLCEHSRRRSRCKDCGGSGICEHSRQRSTCKECKSFKSSL